MTPSDVTTVDIIAQTPGPKRRSGTLGALWLLVRRRTWRDRLLVLSSALIVALATLLALSGPELVSRTLDDGAADAVTAAGSDADIVVTVPVGNPGGNNSTSVKGIPTDDFAALGETVVGALPPRTQSVVKDHESWVLAHPVPVAWTATPAAVATAQADGSELAKDSRVGTYVQFGYSAQAETVLVDGREPTAPSAPTKTPDGETITPPIEVTVSQEFADALDMGIGYQFLGSTSGGDTAIFEIVGIVAPKDPDAAVWDHFPEFTAPHESVEGSLTDIHRGTIMMSLATFAGTTNALRTPFAGNVRITVDPDKMTLDLARAIARELNAMPTNGKDLLDPDAGVSATVKTGLAAALEEYPARARAALAQMSIIIAGVVSVAALVIALMADLLLSRRKRDIALERARGASVASISLRLFAESVIITVLGLVAGTVAASLVTRGVSLTSGLVYVVAVVSLLSSPALGALQARGTWTGRREAANRQDRAKVAKARKARRATLEATILLIAAAAVVSLRGRGVLQSVTAGVDPFLALAPVLIALAIVIIVVRLYPIPMAIVQFLARRTRGVAGILTLSKSRERLAVLPLLALTLAISIAIAGGLLVTTVRSGQEEASWQRVGADVRINSEVTPVQAADLEAQGLTVSRGIYQPSSIITFGGDFNEANLFAMDKNYPAILAAGGVEDVSSLQRMYDAASQISPIEPIPSLASQELVDADVHADSAVYIGRRYVDVDVIGVAEFTPDGWTDGPPYLVMPLEQLLAQPFDDPIALNIAFVSGPGAAAAVAAEPEIDQTTVTTREGWLAAVQDSALIGGVERAIAVAVIAIALLGAVALLVTVLRGVSERGRALSMLRTQGMGAGYGWWLALAELAPLTLAAVVGGAFGGLAIMALLGSALGLTLLSGGITEPTLAIDPTFLAIVGGGILVLLFLAVAVEVLAHRRNKLSDVLRWGQSQ